MTTPSYHRDDLPEVALRQRMNDRYNDRYLGLDEVDDVHGDAAPATTYAERETQLKDQMNARYTRGK